MFTIHEGEIVVKEKYGSSPNVRYYVKPPEQSNIVVLDEQKLSDVAGWFTKIFLPQGYPDSVSKDYIAYQVWDTAQAFCSTITGTLATQEVLRGVGVGDTAATPLAATVTWVIKDGCGHLGKIFFAFSHGTYLDAYSKKWRLYADTLNDAAMCIEIALPLFKNYTTFALCVSTVMKAIVGVAGGATRAAMTQHHAIRGNMADVSAKDSAQETAVNLVASFAALLIITVFGNSLVIFLLMMVLHIIFNYFAVRAVCLRTLNEPRFLQVVDTYLRQEVLPTPCEINRKEPIIFYHLGPNLLDLKLCGFQIRVGCSIKKFISQRPKASYMMSIKEVYSERMYVLVPCINKRKMYVLIKDDATTDDILCAYFHAVLLSIIVCAINDFPLSMYHSNGDSRPFAQVCQTLQSAEWSREPTETPDTLSGFLYEPTHELIGYVDKIVQTEWRRVRAGLITTGWDLSKHLIMVDEWRVCSKKIVTESIPMEKPAVGSLMEFAKIIPFGDVLNDFDTCEKEDKDAFTIEPETSMLKLAQASKLSVKPKLETVDDEDAEGNVTTSATNTQTSSAHLKED
ncbi:RUS family member 1 isoform X2 [Ostrinia nubilalis]|uniref:RUS family member 1 isoform X2 n=1 Tax=Ostrinia nubilalis TaxID=29057 RepID=UPI0030822FDC